MKLSPDQASACEAIRSWVYARCDTWREGELGDILTCGGVAGSGKSTILGVLASEFKNRGLLVAYAAYTGRAGTVLSRKLADQGVFTSNRMKAASDRQRDGQFARFFLQKGEEKMPFCGTLHRLLYAPMIDNKTEELLGWNTRPKLDRRYGLITVDEASMVTDEMLTDLRRHGVPVLCVGDHGQLSPVMGKGSLMQNPTIRLEKIHRQAESSSIIRLSRAVRETGKFDRSLAGDEVIFGLRKNLGETYKAAIDAQKGFLEKAMLDVGALCWTNKTRVSANRIIRKTLGFSGAPKTYEPMVCLKNYTDVFNGMRGILLSDARPFDGFKLSASISFPAEEINDEFEICGYQLFRERTFADVDELKRLVPSIRKMSDAGRLFDMAYCMTTHKMQGSSWKHAILIADRPFSSDEETRRFYYSAVTRASERLTVLT